MTFRQAMMTRDPLPDFKPLKDTEIENIYKSSFKCSLYEKVPRIIDKKSFKIFEFGKLFILSKDILDIKEKLIDECFKNIPEKLRSQDITKIRSISGLNMKPAKWPNMHNDSYLKIDNRLLSIIDKIMTKIYERNQPVDAFSVAKNSFPGMPLLPGDPDMVETKLFRYKRIAKNINEIFDLFNKKDLYTLVKKHNVTNLGRCGYRWQPDSSLKGPKERLVWSIEDCLKGNKNGQYPSDKSTEYKNNFAGRLRVFIGLHSGLNMLVLTASKELKDNMKKVPILTIQGNDHVNRYLREVTDVDEWVVETLDIKEWDNNVNPECLIRMVDSMKVNNLTKELIFFSIVAPWYMHSPFERAHDPYKDEVFLLGDPLHINRMRFRFLESGNGMTSEFGTIPNLAAAIHALNLDREDAFIDDLFNERTKSKILCKGDNTFILLNYVELNHYRDENKKFKNSADLKRIFKEKHLFDISYDDIPKFLGKLILKEERLCVDNEVSSFGNFLAPETEFGSKRRRGASLGYLTKRNNSTYAKFLYEIFENYVNTKFHINFENMNKTLEKEFFQELKNLENVSTTLTDKDLEVLNDVSLLSWKYDERDVSPFIRELAIKKVSIGDFEIILNKMKEGL